MVAEFKQPQTLDEALALLAQHGDEAKVLAGGTDLMQQLAHKQLSPGVLVHIERISELSGISSNRSLTIGTLTSHRNLATSKKLEKHFESLRGAANLVGGWQTQIAGTLGGNICNASPAADLAAPLLIHDAHLTLQSESRGERTLAVNEFLQGRRQTARAPDELVTHFQIEAPPPSSHDLYLKVGRRGATEVAIAGLALRLTLKEDGETVEDVRIATCAVGPVPQRIATAEAILSQHQLTSQAIDAACDALLASSAPIDDVRGSASYRNALLPRLLRHALDRTRISFQRQ